MAACFSKSAQDKIKQLSMVVVDHNGQKTGAKGAQKLTADPYETFQSPQETTEDPIGCKQQKCHHQHAHNFSNICNFSNCIWEEKINSIDKRLSCVEENLCGLQEKVHHRVYRSQYTIHKNCKQISLISLLT